MARQTKTRHAGDNIPLSHFGHKLVKCPICGRKAVKLGKGYGHKAEYCVLAVFWSDVCWPANQQPSNKVMSKP